MEEFNIHNMGQKKRIRSLALDAPIIILNLVVLENNSGPYHGHMTIFQAQKLAIPH